MAVLWIANGRAGDPELAFRSVGYDDSGSSEWFGTGVTGGDFDGDGYGDVVITEPDETVFQWYPGGPSGPAKAPRITWRDTPAHDIDGDGGVWLGALVKAGDFNADGYADLVATETDPSNASVTQYLGGPGGPVESSARLFYQPPGIFGPFFGGALAGGGDVDGDGYDDLFAGDWYFQLDDSWDEANYYGAIFWYSGSDAGLDGCPEMLTYPDPAHTALTSFGMWIDAGKDLNGDGYDDLAALCQGCGETGVDGLTWFGGGAAGPTLAQGEGEVTLLADAAGNVALVQDMDGDGYDELASVAAGETQLWYGSAQGPGHGEPVVFPWARTAADGAGDLDGDGLGDLILGDYWSETVGVVFGDAARPANPEVLVLPKPEGPGSWAWWGWHVYGVGDLNADGHDDVVVPALMKDFFESSVHVYLPVCTWYADADGDGAGDPEVSQSTCHDPGAGWASAPDDCDDGDATAQGSEWYIDGDGDGYGPIGPATFGCEAPVGGGAVTVSGDCDDTDPAVHPDAEDVSGDGLDPDCDGHDGAWVFDTGDCPDTGDSGETGDTADDIDTADTAGTARADTGDAAGHDSGKEVGGDCGCAAGGAPAVWGGAAFAGVAALRRLRGRRRAG